MKTSITKRIAKNFTWLSIGDIISRGLNFFAIIYIARVLGVAAFGLFNFAQAFLAYLVLLVDSGLSLFGTREIAKAKEKTGAFSLNIFAVRFLIALVTFILSFLILIFLPLSFELRLFFIGTFLFVFYRALNTDWVFQGLERMECIAFSRILFSSLAFGLIVLFIKNSGDLIKVPFILFISGVAGALVFLFILFRYFTPATLGHLAPSNWWDYFSEAIPLGASIILIQIYYNMDTIILGFMDKPEVVGYYNAAYRIFFIFTGFLALWQSTVFPIVSKIINEDRDRTEIFLNKYVRLTLLAAFPIVLLTTFLSSFLITLFYGTEYSASSPALQILIWSILLIVINGIYGMLILIPLGKSKEFLYGVGSGAIVNMILNLLLIPPFSFIGAAIATLLAEIMVTTAMFYLVRKEIQVNIVSSMRVPIFASLIASFFFFIFIQWGSPILREINSSISFLAAYFVVILFLGEREFLQSFYAELRRE